MNFSTSLYTRSMMSSYVFCLLASLQFYNSSSSMVLPKQLPEYVTWLLIPMAELQHYVYHYKYFISFLLFFSSFLILALFPFFWSVCRKYFILNLKLRNIYWYYSFTSSDWNVGVLSFCPSWASKWICMILFRLWFNDNSENLIFFWSFNLFEQILSAKAKFQKLNFLKLFIYRRWSTAGTSTTWNTTACTITISNPNKETIQSYNKNQWIWRYQTRRIYTTKSTR